MSKYDKLWKYISNQSQEEPLTLTFNEIEKIAGIPVDHSFLNYKKELLEYGFQVDKISLKNQWIKFSKKDI